MYSGKSKKLIIHKGPLGESTLLGLPNQTRPIINSLEGGWGLFSLHRWIDGITANLLNKYIFLQSSMHSA